ERREQRRPLPGVGAGVRRVHRLRPALREDRQSGRHLRGRKRRAGVHRRQDGPAGDEVHPDPHRARPRERPAQARGGRGGRGNHKARPDLRQRQRHNARLRGPRPRLLRPGAPPRQAGQRRLRQLLRFLGGGLPRRGTAPLGGHRVRRAHGGPGASGGDLLARVHGHEPGHTAGRHRSRRAGGFPPPARGHGNRRRPVRRRRGHAPEGEPAGGERGPGRQERQGVQADPRRARV
ncbi:MAG: hypothetical protein AVDCRST_MAG55-2799, partial [uncultured Rubrobacteraceae bacterium]